MTVKMQKSQVKKDFTSKLAKSKEMETSSSFAILMADFICSRFWWAYLTTSHCTKK
jgi:hypothetical protein